MRYFFILILIIACLGSAYAFELGNQQNSEKSSSHVGRNPGTPVIREGGENMATAFPVLSIPFSDTGNTTNHLDDYDEACPYTGSTSPDLVYIYEAPHDIVLSIDLCGSGYDTKTYVYQGSGNLEFCNDDAYFDDTCGQYVSLIEAAYLVGGQTYYFVIDGYGGDAGDYILNIDEYFPAPPCVLECNGLSEGEPALGPAYEDAFNGGCNSPEFNEPWGDLTEAGDANGDLVFCGVAGWTDTDRDTDWNYLMIGEFGMVEITVDAEQLTNVYTLTGSCASGIAVDQSMTVGICAPGTLVVQGSPGDIFMLWFGASEYTPPAGFFGYEYDYVANFSGLHSGNCTSTRNASIDRIKSLYR